MKNVLMCTCTAFAFFVAAAVAQTTPSTDNTAPGNQGTQSSSPSMSGTTGNTQGTMSGDASSNSNLKSERKMKGCIQSQGGQYMLQTKRGKDVMLSGQDVSAHVGHEVTVHGMWMGGMSGMSNTSSSGTAGSASASGKSFQVTSVDMISETCSMGKGDKSGMSGSGMSGSSGSNTGTSSTGTTPPQ